MSKPTLTRHLSKAWCRIPGDTYHVYCWPRRLDCVSKAHAMRELSIQTRDSFNMGYEKAVYESCLKRERLGFQNTYNAMCEGLTWCDACDGEGKDYGGSNVNLNNYDKPQDYGVPCKVCEGKGVL